MFLPPKTEDRATVGVVVMGIVLVSVAGAIIVERFKR